MQLKTKVGGATISSATVTGCAHAESHRIISDSDLNVQDTSDFIKITFRRPPCRVTSVGWRLKDAQISEGFRSIVQRLTPDVFIAQDIPPKMSQAIEECMPHHGKVDQTLNGWGTDCQIYFAEWLHAERSNVETMPTGAKFFYVQLRDRTSARGRFIAGTMFMPDNKTDFRKNEAFFERISGGMPAIIYISVDDSRSAFNALKSSSLQDCFSCLNLPLRPTYPQRPVTVPEPDQVLDFLCHKDGTHSYIRPLICSVLDSLQSESGQPIAAHMPVHACYELVSPPKIAGGAKGVEEVSYVGRLKEGGRWSVREDNRIPLIIDEDDKAPRMKGNRVRSSMLTSDTTDVPSSSWTQRASGYSLGSYGLESIGSSFHNVSIDSMTELVANWFNGESSTASRTGGRVGKKKKGTVRGMEPSTGSGQEKKVSEVNNTKGDSYGDFDLRGERKSNEFPYDAPVIGGREGSEYDVHHFGRSKSSEHDATVLGRGKNSEYDAPVMGGGKISEYDSPVLSGRKSSEYYAPVFDGGRSSEYYASVLDGGISCEYDTSVLGGRRGSEHDSPDLGGRKSSEYDSHFRGGKKSSKYDTTVLGERKSSEYDSHVLGWRKSSDYDSPFPGERKSSEYDSPVLGGRKSSEYDSPFPGEGESSEYDAAVMGGGKITEYDAPVLGVKKSSLYDVYILGEGKSSESGAPALGEGKTSEYDALPMEVREAAQYNASVSGGEKSSVYHLRQGGKRDSDAPLTAAPRASEIDDPRSVQMDIPGVIPAKEDKMTVRDNGLLSRSSEFMVERSTQRRSTFSLADMDDQL